MSHAIDVIEAAVGRTKKLLFPFNLKFWLKLTLVLYLMGFNLSGFNSNSGNFEGGDFDLSGNVLIMIVAIAIILIILGFVFAFISSVCTFVFLESVVTKKVKLIASFKKYLKKGIQLLLFNFVIGILTFVLILLFAVPGILIFSRGGLDNPLILIPYLIFAAILVVTLLIFISIVTSFTFDFIVPIMYKKGTGILASWRQFIRVMKRNRRQLLIYIFVKLFLKMAAGIIGLIITLLVLLVLALLLGIPLLIIAIAIGASGLASMSLSTIPIPVIILLVIIGIIAILAFSFVTTFCLLPIPVFFRFYSLLFLEKINPEMSVFHKAKKQETPKKKEVRASEFSVY